MEKYHNPRATEGESIFSNSFHSAFHINKNLYLVTTWFMWPYFNNSMDRVMVFNATLSNISVISWRSVLVEKTIDLSQVTDKRHHIMLYQVHLAWTGFELTTSVVIGTDCIGSSKSNDDPYNSLKGHKTGLTVHVYSNVSIDGFTYLVCFARFDLVLHLSWGLFRIETQDRLNIIICPWAKQYTGAHIYTNTYRNKTAQRANALRPHRILSM